MSVGETYTVDVVVLRLDELKALVLDTQSSQMELVSLELVQLPPPYEPLYAGYVGYAAELVVEEEARASATESVLDVVDVLDPTELLVVVQSSLFVC